MSNYSDLYSEDYYSDLFFRTDAVSSRSLVTSREVVLFITLTCCIGPLNVLGIFTNILCCVVFQKYPTRGSTTFLFQVLSVADSVFLFNNILYLSVQYYYAYCGRYLEFYSLYGHFLPVLVGLTELSRDFSVWCVVLTTIDRFLGICYPLNSPKWCSVHKAAAVTAVVFVCTVLFNIPEFMFSKIQKFGDTYNLVPTELGDNFIFNVVYFTFDVLLNLMIPMYLVLYMNCRICWEIVKARRHRVTMARGNLPRHAKMTRMLIAVAVFFLICQIPRVIATIYNCHSLYSQLYHNNYFFNQESVPFVIYSLSHILQNCNALGNFYIYCVTGKQFRTVLWRVCRCKRVRRRNSFSSEETRKFSIASTTLRKVSSWLTPSESVRGQKRPRYTQTNL